MSHQNPGRNRVNATSTRARDSQSLLLTRKKPWVAAANTSIASTEAATTTRK